MLTPRVSAAFLVIGFVMMAYSESRADPLARLREISEKRQPSMPEYEEAKTILKAVEQTAETGDVTVLEPLFRIVENDDSHGMICVPILPVLAAKANADYADKLLALMRAKMAGLAQVQITANDVKHGRDAALLGRFVESCVEETLKKVPDPKPLLELLVQYGSLKTGWARPDLRQKALHDVATANVDAGIRKDYAFKVFQLMPNYPAPEGFADLFQEKDFPKLREMIRASREKPDMFCYGAADVLSHHGDREILPDLKLFLATYASGKSTPDGMIKWNIWKIENQYPPSKLLDYIRGSVRLASDGRVWAMKRAIELGVDKKAIRDAILAHAEAVKLDTTQAYDLIALKKIAIDTRVLTSTDLPDVAVTQVMPTP